jgi:hypothetical protein
MRILLVVLFCISGHANAWFFFFPIPNMSKPAALNSLIDALEKSDETKAVAYVSESKAFGQKMWAWGHHSGRMTQAEADKTALARCEASLAKAKAASAGGQPLYDFGAKRCELHEFLNKTVKLPEPPPAPVIQPVEPQENPTARRLRELDELRKNNLITEQEYAEKRLAIIADM